MRETDIYLDQDLDSFLVIVVTEIQWIEFIFDQSHGGPGEGLLFVSAHPCMLPFV